MYGKIFESIFDGSTGDHWEAWATLVAMVVLSDRDGNLRMTAGGLSRRCGLPLDAVERGLDVLSKPDPESSSPEEDGRRVVRDGSGWRVVNKALYRDATDMDHVREVNRARQQRYRDRRNVTNNVTVTHCHAPSRHTDTDTDRTNRKEPTGSFIQGCTPVQESLEGVQKPDPVVLTVPLRRGEFQVLESHVATWRGLYPAVDVPQELRKLLGWNLANPGKRKTGRGILHHVTGWLAAAQDAAAPKAAGSRRSSDEEHFRANLA